MNRILAVLLVASIFPSYASQTIKVAAIRVEFVQDTNELTTGDGTFAVDSVTSDPFAIDPAPHNRTYFKDQLIAADNYFNNVSGGKVRIAGDVFPKGLKDAYLLSNEMKYYNPNTTLNEIDKGIATLFSDAVQLADQDPDLNFSDYDLVVVFHAGVGRDIDLGFDETPQDIPSLYVNEQFMQKNLDPDFSGISVDNGASVVKQGIILPETENQQDVQVALTGILVSNIGSYLGLFDLFSPTEQRSGIGKFGLMDVGLFNVNGLIPSPPCAFSRKKLGWDVPYVLKNDMDNVQIARFQSGAASPTLIEIPMNEDESFLLEYRGNHKDNIDSLLYVLSEGREVFPGYLEVLKTYLADRITVSDSSGVLLGVDDYDLGLAGSGILIWHIDQSVIRNAVNNAINDNPDWRAVDLEEADGSQDIGQAYSLLDAGYQSELGTLLDFWYKGNPAPLFKNEFNFTSTPGSYSNLNRANSGVDISDFSANSSDIMTFDYKRSYYETGFPVNYGTGSNITYSVSGVPEGKNYNFIFTVNDSGYIFAYGEKGHGLFFDSKNQLAAIGSDGNGKLSIALADTNSNGKYDLLFALSGSELYGFDLTNFGSDSLARQIFVTNDLTAAFSDIVVNQNHIFYFDGLNINSYSFNGSLTLIEQSAQNLNDLIIENLSPVETGVDGDYVVKIPGNKIIIISNEDDQPLGRSLISLYDQDLQRVVKSFPSEHISGPFSVADIDNNGTVDICYIADDKIIARNLSGSYIQNFPITPVLSDDEKPTGTPMLVNLDGIGNIALFVTTNRGQIIAYNVQGKILEGFPVSAGGTMQEATIITQLDSDPALELVSVSTGGVASSWEISQTNESSFVLWGQTNFNATNNAIYTFETSVSRIGKDLVPESRFFNYPNPNEGEITTIRYYLNDNATVKLRLFDASGYKVDEFTGPGEAGTDNEVVWNVTDIASGVYLCQLEAKSDTKTERRLIKILVVH